MAQSLPPTHIDAQVGDVSGGSQVAIGSYIVQIGRVEGGVVNILNKEPTPPRSRPQPVSLRPRAFPGLLDRETETTNTLQALASNQSVECSGEAGSGKTSLLRHLAYQPQVSNFAAGVIYFQVHQQTNADLLQSFFDAFYEYDSPIKPTETEIRHYLQSLNALILLDDVEITPEQIESLMNIAPGCTFVAATGKRSLMGETREVSLKGLPTGEALSLFERELGRALSAEERSAAQSICESLGCLPQRVLRAAHETREENRPLAAVAPQASAPAGDEPVTLAAAELKPRSEDEKKVLAACAVFYGAPVTAEHLTAVAGVTGDVQPMLDDFEKRGLVQSHDNRYMLASDVNNALLGNSALVGNLNPWFTRALTHFEDWLEKHKGNHKLIAESAGPILLIIQWAVAARFWLEVRHLAHGVEEALAVTGKWDMWANSLQAVLKAAKREENRAEEAWALHQLGTRALCLGATPEAKSSLTEALHLREALNDQSGAAVTRHNLNLLLLPPPPKSEPKSETTPEPQAEPKPEPPPPAPVPRPLPLLVKLGVAVLIVLALLTALVIWRLWPRPVVAAANILSFTVDPATIPAGAQAQLCYEVENAKSVRLEPGIGVAKPGKECVNVTAAQTTVYTLTAVGADGKSVPRQVTLNVEAAPPAARIVRFEVLREIGPGGASDVQFRLCYEVRNANHAELDNNGGEVVLDEPRCQQVTPAQTNVYTLSATGADGRTVTRQVTVDATKPPSPPPQILSFEAVPAGIVAGEKAQLCFQVRDASSVQIDSGAPRPEPGTERQCVSVAALKTTVYTLMAVNAEGKTTSRQTTIRVSQPPPRILDFSAQPASLRGAGSVRLCYETLNAEGLQIDHGVGAVKPAKGCVDAQVSETTTFTLTATGAERQTQRSQTRVEVAAAPTEPIEIEFTVDPDRITIPGAANLCYRIKQASAAKIDPDVGRIKLPPPGERLCVKVSPTRSTTYTLTATASANRLETRQIQVLVTEAQPKHARIIFFEVTPARIKAGERVRVCYGVADAIRAGIAPLKNDIALVEKECLTDSPEKSTRYVLRAMGEDKQTETREAGVEVEPQALKHARILFFEARPNRIQRSGSVRLCYGVADAIRAGIAPIKNDIALAEKECLTDSPEKSTRYVLRAMGEDQQTETREATVEVAQPELPSVRITRFEINPTVVHGTQLCYALENARSARIDPDFGELSNLANGCPKLKSIETRTYTLTATGQDGKAQQRSVQYTPPEPPKEIPIRITSFSPPTQTIKQGGQAKLCYSTFGEGSAQISPQVGGVPPSLLKRCVVVSPRENTVYTLTVTGSNRQTDSRRAIVKVEKQGGTIF